MKIKINGSVYTTSDYLVTPPTIKGFYRFGKLKYNTTKIGLYHKPNFIHRFFMKTFLGLYWENETQI